MEGYKFTGTQRDCCLKKKLTPSLFNDVEEFISEIDFVVERNSKSYDKIEKKVEDNTFKIYGASDIKDFKKDLVISNIIKPPSLVLSQHIGNKKMLGPKKC